MNKKLMIALTVVLVLLVMILGISLGMGKDTPADSIDEATVETTEKMMPGLDNSIFDLPEEELAALLATEASAETEETKPAVTVPSDSSHVRGDGNDEEDKIEVPETPKGNKSQATTPTQPKPTDPTQPKPTQPKPTEPTQPKPTEPTQPKPTQPKPTEPTQPTEKEPDATQNIEPAPQKPAATVQCEFDKYHSMSPADQRSYMESFEDIETFFDWYNKVKADHEAIHPSVDITDGNINLGDYK